MKPTANERDNIERERKALEEERNAFKKEQEVAAKLARLKELEAKEEEAKQQSLQQLPNNNFSFPSQYSGFLYS